MELINKKSQRIKRKGNKQNQTSFCKQLTNVLTLFHQLINLFWKSYSQKINKSIQNTNP